MPSRRRLVLAAVLVFVAVLATSILSQVLATVFFAITIAYVLYPLRQRLVARGASARVASAVSSLVALVVVLLIIVPLVVLLYQRRRQLLELLRTLPSEVTVEFSELTYVVDVTALVSELQSVLGDLALTLARAAPVLALKLTLLGFVVYGLLLRPQAPKHIVYGIVPTEYHDIVRALDRRVRETLFAIYVLQAVTAMVTFLAALVVFAVLGYQAPFALAVVAGILQFIPIVGPSLLVLALAAHDAAFGDPTRAVAVLVLGLVVVSFLPDAVIRPRLAARTAHLPASVYFIGFTGGVLSLGVVGFIAGPLVVALLVEAVVLFSASTRTKQTTFDTESEQE